MYINISKPRRGVAGYGMGWSGGFTLPGSTTRYSTETCTGSAASPMTGGNTICGQQNEAAYLNSIGCVAVGFRGEHDCVTDAGNAGAIYCCPPGILASELARGGGVPAQVASLLPSTGIGGMQVASLIGLAALIGGLGFILWRNRAREIEQGRDRLEYLDWED